MQNYLINGLTAAALLLAGLALTGCGDDITNVLEDTGLTDGDGSDRTAGGVYSTGTWKAAGTNSDGNPFRACFNISVDGETLTRNGSDCTSYQNAFSVDVEGSTDCNVYFDDNLSNPTDPVYRPIPIAADGTFSKTFQPDPRAPELSFEGTITNGDAKGTITVDNTAWGGGICKARWVAYAPGNTGTTTPAPNPDDNTTPPGDRPAAGTWTGTGTSTIDGGTYTACLNVNADGTALTRTNTGCTNNGQNQNQFDVQIERGDPNDDDDNCYLYLGDGDQDSQIEVPIVNNKIVLNNYRPSSWAPALSFEGTFNGNTASGTITIDSQYPGGSCKGSWSVNAP